MFRRLIIVRAYSLLKDFWKLWVVWSQIESLCEPDTALTGPSSRSQRNRLDETLVSQGNYRGARNTILYLLYTMHLKDYVDLQKGFCSMCRLGVIVGCILWPRFFVFLSLSYRYGPPKSALRKRMLQVLQGSTSKAAPMRPPTSIQGGTHLYVGSPAAG